MKKFFKSISVALAAIAAGTGIFCTSAFAGADADFSDITWNVNETYENGTTPVVSITSFGQGLKPQNGSAVIVSDPTGVNRTKVLATMYAPGGASGEGYSIDTRFPFGKFAPGEVKAIEFDIYLRKDAYFLFSIRTSKWGWGTQGMLSENGYMTLSKSMSSDGMTSAKWQSSGIYALLSKSKEEQLEQNQIAVDFTNGEWHTIRMVFDTKNKIDYLYLDGEYVGEIAEPFDDTTYFQFTNLSHVDRNETLFYIDNLKMGSVQKVKSVSVFDFSGDKYFEGEQVPRAIKSIDVAFSVAPDESSLSADTVKLLCNGESIEYNVNGFDATTNAYSITPKLLPQKNDKLSVEVSGVKAAAGGEISAYTAEFTVAEGDGAFGILPISFKDSEGNSVNSVGADSVFIDTSFVNTTEKDEKIIVALVAYKDSMMIKAAQRVITVSGNSIYNINEAENALSLSEVSDADSICAMIQSAGEARYPLAEAVWLN